MRAFSFDPPLDLVIECLVLGPSRMSAQVHDRIVRSERSDQLLLIDAAYRVSESTAARITRES